MKHAFTLLALAYCLFACSPSHTIENSTERVDYQAFTLLEVAQLSAILGKDTSLKLIDVRTAAEYAKGHIPLALQVYRNDIEDLENPVKGMMATKAQMEVLLSRLGIAPTDFIVIYDAKGNPDASRLWWMLDFYGHPHKALLNGGLLAWEGAGLATSAENQAIEPATAYRFAEKLQSERYASQAEVELALKDTNYVIIDARTIEEYEGTEPLGKYKRVGRIPKSIFISHESNIDFAKQSKFKSLDELKALYKGIDRSKKIICYCKSGVRSAMTTYVLTELLGYKDVKNYDGSWLEWNMRENLPIE